jgi:hypothetical protein
MDPRGPVFQQERLTSVSVGSHDTTHTYALVDVCADCHDIETRAKEDERRRGWWFAVWWWGFFLNAFLAIIFPINAYPYVAALALRGCWKLWARWRRCVPVLVND